MRPIHLHITKITILIFLLISIPLQLPGIELTLENQINSAVLRVGSQQTYPPIEFKNHQTGEMQGLSTDLLTEVAKRLNLRIEWVQVDYGALITGLIAGRFDIASGGLSDQPERRKKIDFVNYLNVGTGILVRKPDISKYQSLEDFSGKSVAFSLGATKIATLVNKVSNDLERKGKPPITIVTLPNTSDGLMQLNLHRVEGYLNETAMLAYLIKNIPDRYAMVGNGKYTLTPLLSSWGFNKDNKLLRDSVHSELQKMFIDGTYFRILKKWNLLEGQLKGITINGQL